MYTYKAAAFLEHIGDFRKMMVGKKYITDLNELAVVAELISVLDKTHEKAREYHRHTFEHGLNLASLYLIAELNSEMAILENFLAKNRKYPSIQEAAPTMGGALTQLNDINDPAR